MKIESNQTEKVNETSRLTEKRIISSSARKRLATLVKKTKNGREGLFDLSKNMTMKFDFKKYPKCLFLFIGDSCACMYLIQLHLLHYSEDKITSIFKNEHSMSDNEVKILITNFLKDRMGLRIDSLSSFPQKSFKTVEKHFNKTEPEIKKQSVPVKKVNAKKITKK